MINHDDKTLSIRVYLPCFLLFPILTFKNPFEKKMPRTYGSLRKRNTNDSKLMEYQIYEFHGYRKIWPNEHFRNSF